MSPASIRCRSFTRSRLAARRHTSCRCLERSKCGWIAQAIESSVWRTDCADGRRAELIVVPASPGCRVQVEFHGWRALVTDCYSWTFSSVLKRPSQQVRRELASGERFSGVSGPGQSTGLPRKAQETCHSARRPVRRRALLVWELAEEVRPDTNGLKAGALESRPADIVAHRRPEDFGEAMCLRREFHMHLSGPTRPPSDVDD